MSLPANTYINEGTVTGTSILDFGSYIRRLTVTNDSTTKDLKWKFNGGETYGTLKPTESLSLDCRTKTLWLQGDGPYRAWGFG